jgi:hypothetical protein
VLRSQVVQSAHEFEPAGSVAQGVVPSARGGTVTFW